MHLASCGKSVPAIRPSVAETIGRKKKETEDNLDRSRMRKNVKSDITAQHGNINHQRLLY